MLNPIDVISRLSNDILVAQETAKLTKVKVEGLLKNFAGRPDSMCTLAARVRVLDLFFTSPTLTSGSFAAP